MAKATRLVRYVSPFGSPAWMHPEQAERQLATDSWRWEWLAAVEAETGEQVLSAEQRQVSAPRIERAA